MVENSTHVTMAQIAAAAGVARATVSYALNGDPKIPPKTTTRILAVAKRLGYRPNPRVAALMAHIRQSQAVTRGERIAFLWMNARPRERTFPAIYEGARLRADQLGYALEEFWLDTPGISPARLCRIMRARGITGLLISPILEGPPRFTIDWDWSQFAPAIIGNAACTPELHHAGHHHFAGMCTAMLALRAQGIRRIAALLDRDINERAKRAWSAAFLEHHPEPLRARRWLRLILRTKHTGVTSWLRLVRPSALITTSNHAQLVMRLPLADTSRPQCVVLDRPTGNCHWAGIDQGEEVIAANAVDLVVGQLLRNERGAPGNVKMLLFPGHWMPASEAHDAVASNQKKGPAGYSGGDTRRQKQRRQ
jgi:LacI family transcriptional regulator